MRFFPDCTDFLISLGYKGKLINYSEIIEWVRNVQKVNIWIEHGHTGKKDKIRHDITISGLGCLRGGYITYEEAQKSAIEIFCHRYDTIIKEKERKKNKKTEEVEE